MIILSDFGRKNSCIVRVGLYHVMIPFFGGRGLFELTGPRSPSCEAVFWRLSKQDDRGDVGLHS